MPEKPTYEELEAQVRTLEKAQGQSRRALQESEERCRSLTDRLFAKIDRQQKKLEDLSETMDMAQEMAGIGYWSYDRKTGKRIWSARMYENFGLDPDLGPPRLEDIREVFHPEDRPVYERNIENAIDGVPYDQVARIVFSGGTLRYVHTRGRPKTDEKGETIGLFGTSQDITERVLAEKTLRESEENYRRIFENSVVGFFQSTPEGHFVSVNSAFAKMLHYRSPEELLSSISDIKIQYYANPEDRSRYQEILQREGKVDGFEFKVQCKDGAVIWVSNSTRAYFDAEGRVSRYEGAVHEITERKKAEEALRQSEERYRSLVENTLDGFFVCEIPSGRFLFLNQRICDLFRFAMPDALGLTLWDVIDPQDQPLVKERIQERIEGRLPSFNSNIYTVVRNGGARFKAEVSTSLITYRERTVVQGILRDVTEKERLELQLQQAQKLEAIGTLAGGIAHNFNNLLMGIQGRASLAAAELGPSGHIDAIEEYVHRATHLTGQLLGLARSGKYEVAPIDINELLAASADMFGCTRREIRIRKQIHPAPLVVEADSQQIEQVLLNVFINAWQAMPEGGDLHLKTSITRLDRSSEKQRIEPGLYAEISIADTGIGMSEQTRRRIFDPFFTTKDKRRGTGLGLASAYGIVRNHGGRIAVSSQVGKGSTFHIYLPLSDKEVIRKESAEEAPLKGSETVLLVDDEEMVRAVSQAMLERLGYRVLTAENGEDAVSEVARDGEKIDLVILDLIMPGMDGAKSFERIRAFCPRMPVLLSSGYAIDGQASGILRKGANGFIQKPFTISELSVKVREILGRIRGPRKEGV